MTTSVPFFSGADVERAVSPHEAYDAVKEAFVAHATGRVDDAAEALRDELSSRETSAPCLRSAAGTRC